MHRFRPRTRMPPSDGADARDDMFEDIALLPGIKVIVQEQWPVSAIYLVMEGSTWGQEMQYQRFRALGRGLRPWICKPELA
jgi:hypothetical protein